MIKYQKKAFSLVELIIFIVIIGIAMTFLGPLTNSIKLGASSGNQLRALQFARGRMEMILASYTMNGFSNFTDPCSGGSAPSACSISNFSATTSITTGWNNSNRFKVITVTVSGLSSATLTSLVGDNG